MKKICSVLTVLLLVGPAPAATSDFSLFITNEAPSAPPATVGNINVT